ncbi:Leucine rich repeat containing 42 [Branchiostoma belcheri]|nr:Leucine rich repeat containing 42 [Branchiostoma belcheri]
MYFDTFPREAVDQLSETGPFYVRHRDGTMRSLGRPAHGPPEKRPRLEPPGPELDRRSSHASRVNGAPRKLFSLCLDFVAENIHLVDSLVDFPEMVGHQLFKAVQDTGRFGVPDEAARTLGLFCEAYGALVLSSLTVRGQVLPLNDYLQPGIQYMTALQQLDLSNCGLGDEHGILGEISQMSSLSQLSLQGNCLSQRGVQRVTLPYKMFGRGPAGMEVFNLADNAELSDKVVGCLVPFKRLRAVNLSNTSLTKSGIKKLCDQGWAEWTDTLPEFSEDNAISNIGWAQKVVEDWFQPAKTQNSCVPTTADDENQSDRRSLSLRKFSQTTKHYDSSDHVIFEKTTTKQKCMQSRQLSKQDGNKSLKGDNNMTVVVREKDEDKFNRWSDEEGDLLKSYLQPESKPSPKLSLMSAMESW